MTDLSAAFNPFAPKMARENLPQIAIDTFEHYYRQLLQGETGLIPEADIAPVSHLPNADTFSADIDAAGQAALPQTVVIKLNGGLGTSMGLSRAKSLLPVKDGLTFLDIIARQAIQIDMPMVLMNSFATQADSLALLAQYPSLQTSLPLDFVQHKVPKIQQDNLSPVNWPDEPHLEWCPPGHGDIYTALITSGMLDTLLNRGYRYAFVSNADNLGAVMDTTILGYFTSNNLPFMMEVADRTEADKKGGHLARRADGQLILREAAQCPADDIPAFQNIHRYRYFNTNSLWLNLSVLKETLARRNQILGLPLIRNAKTVDPRRPDSTPVYQLETAMGAAIAVFEGAQAIRVPRSRFAPVKTTNDLLAVRSDAYTLTPGFRVTLHPTRHSGPPVVNLDADHYKLITDLDDHFPHGAPSLVACTHLTVHGNVVFGANIVISGDVTIEATPGQRRMLPDGSVFSNS